MPVLKLPLMLALGLLAGAFSSPSQAQETARAVKVVSPPALAAVAERREALVIGNGAYGDAPLRNPVSDMRAFAEVLREFDFSVTTLQDADQQRMDDAIRAFKARLSGGGVGLFYFAGHGVSVGGRNYLLPVGRVFDSEAEVKYRAIDAEFVMAAMEEAGARVNLVILDACRNNPFGSRSPFRSASKGLVTMDAPRGSFVAYATAPGSTADDGAGANGLYTQELVRSIRELPGIEVEQLMKKVSARVQSASGGKQVPYRSSSLTGEFFFRPGAAQSPGAELPSRPALARAPLRLVVYRKGVFVNPCDYEVMVDGRRLALLGKKEYLDCEISAEAHSLKVAQTLSRLVSKIHYTLFHLEDRPAPARFIQVESSWNAEDPPVVSEVPEDSWKAHLARGGCYQVEVLP